MACRSGSASTKYDGIKFILAHAGGFVPYIAYRILLTVISQENKARQLLTLADQKHHVPRLLALLKRFYYDVALSSTPAALPSLFEIAEPDHVLYGQRLPLRPARRGQLHGQPIRAHTATGRDPPSHRPGQRRETLPPVRLTPPPSPLE
jgi:hypothetical protein